MLTSEEKARYSRHLMLEEVGEEGQEKLKNARVLIIGSGALATPNALYLAGAGIGMIGVMDDDVVDISNLHRQVIYQTDDIGKSKVECAKARMLALNPDIQVQTYPKRFDLSNAREMIRDYDLILDATDNFVSKFLINDACVLENKPFIHAGVMRYCGQIMSVIPHTSACLGCIFPTPPSSMQLYKNGLFASITGLLGSIAASEVLKFFTGVGKPLIDSILSIDISSMHFSKLKISKNPNCPVCGKNGIKDIRKISCV
ncbi:HesA/MoeB/ThiF family protein [Helicobacter pametensis]|uniref:HesA/MoeB/ThiF family protein n=1 Tax=Helicobacter pametensis TaxID=95149 RepID=UPI00047F0D7D|nr:HesA/MoeB/ThiF family protein [Helicobacter pametensis]